MPKVQAFWKQKLGRIARTQKRFYGEASHFNAKAGLWGGRAGLLPNMEQLALEHYGDQGDRYDDQLFLAKAIWPLIRDRSLTHDSVFDVLPAEPFPTGNERDAPDHVGYSHVLAERTSKMSLNINTQTMKATASERTKES